MIRYLTGVLSDGMITSFKGFGRYLELQLPGYAADIGS